MTPIYNTMTFSQLFSNEAVFEVEYEKSGLPVTITKKSLETLYYLLYARYGNSPFANKDLHQSTLKLFSVIFQYGPTWEKRLDIQSKIRGLNLDELREGPKTIYNQALNPADEPSMHSTEELDYINSQNTANYKKSKLDAYRDIWMLLETDVTEEFITKFKYCFKQFVIPENPLLYSEGDDDEC